MLSLVDVFSSPYQYGNAPNQVINTPYQAANYIASAWVDNRLKDFIDKSLDMSVSYDSWRHSMPSKTPTALSDYQRKYPNYSSIEVEREIGAHGSVLSSGQLLFHGGFWPGGPRLVTNRPLSTSFCPQIALRNAEWGGKAYISNRIDIWVLKVDNPNTKVFVYRRKGTNQGHENEVLFASGAVLTLRSTTIACSYYPVAMYGFPDKKIEVHVMEIDIS